MSLICSVRLDGTQGWKWVLYHILLSAEYPTVYQLKKLLRGEKN